MAAPLPFCGVDLWTRTLIGLQRWPRSTAVGYPTPSGAGAAGHTDDGCL